MQNGHRNHPVSFSSKFQAHFEFAVQVFEGAKGCDFGSIKGIEKKRKGKRKRRERIRPGKEKRIGGKFSFPKLRRSEIGTGKRIVRVLR